MNKPTLSLIAALSENRVIGNKGEIPWHIPGEQKRFKEITTPHPIIMGRKTFESIGRTLPGRPNIVITSDQTYQVDDVFVVHSLGESIEKAKELEEHRLSVIARSETTKQSYTIINSSDEVSPRDRNARILAHDDNASEIFIIGGGKVFEESIVFADKLYLTVIHKTIDGDAFFPEYSEFKNVVYKEDKEVGEYRFTYLDLLKE